MLVAIATARIVMNVCIIRQNNVAEGRSVVFQSVCFSTAERARVGLTTLPGMKGTDYINASYIMVQCPPHRLSLL